MADDMKRRRQRVAAAFVKRRSELKLTQEQVAQRGGIVVRTVQNFEAGRWPNRRSRALLEEVVGWPPGEIERLAEPPKPEPDPKLVELASQLTDEEAAALIALLRRRRDEQARDGGQSQSAASG